MGFWYVKWLCVGVGMLDGNENAMEIGNCDSRTAKIDRKRCSQPTNWIRCLTYAHTFCVCMCVPQYHRQISVCEQPNQLMTFKMAYFE